MRTSPAFDNVSELVPIEGPHFAGVAVGHMPSSRITLIAFGIVAVLLSSSCSSGTSSDDVRSRLTPIANQLATEMNNKTRHDAEFPGNPSQFLKDASRDLAAIRASAADWKSASAQAQLGQTTQNGLPSQAEVAAFTGALDSWIAAQQEQSDLIQACMGAADQTTCLQSGSSENSRRWADAQSKLLNAYRTMGLGAARPNP